MKLFSKVFFGLIIASLSINAISQAPDDGLVAFFPFTGNANDESIYGNDGTVLGASLITDRCEDPDSAYHFDGVDDYIIIPDKPQLNFSNEITLCAWIKPKYFTGHGNNAIISKGYYSHTDPFYQYHLGITGNLYPNNPGKFSFSLSINNQHQIIIADHPVWNEDVWYFVAATYNGNYMRIYINGELANEKYQSGQIDIYNEPLCIGRTYRYPGSQYTPGTIDDIRIYNKALAPNEIKQLYTIKCNIGGLVSYFPFNGNAKDSTGNGNDGFVSGPVLTSDRCGSANSAYYFDGVNDFIDLKSSFDYPERTVNLWISADIIDPIERHVYISDNPDLTNGFTQIKIKETNGIKEVRSSTGVPGPVAEGHGEIKEGEWHMVTVVADADSARHYLDGKLIGKFSNSTYTSDAGHPTTLLGTSRVFDRFYKGKIDDVRIYNRAISVDEINQLYSIPCTTSEGLISYFPFNGDASDATGNGNDGVVYGPILTTDRCGNPNSAYKFDGMNDYISLDRSYILPESKGTFAAWVYFNSLNSIQYLGCLGDIESKDYYLSFVRYDPQYNKLSIYRRTSGNVDILIGSTAINTNEWYFVVMETDGDNWSLYLNGRKENLSIISGDNIGDWGHDLTQADNWLLGGIQIKEPHDHAYLNGKLDDIRIYDYPLSQDEILVLYNTNCPMGITGEQLFCRGQKNVLFSVPPVEDLVYSWTYSGTGATLRSNGNQVYIDFSDDVTSGTLSVSTKRNNDTVNHATLDISFLDLPSDPAKISGPDDACVNDGPYNFIIADIENAQDYSWAFSGQNVELLNESNTLTVYFFNNATSGSITVTGINQCGQGKASEPHPVIVKNCEIPIDQFNIPNAFSPNGDNINDLFVIHGLRESTAVTIFDNNGKILFHTENYANNWDGTDTDGNSILTGTYWYVIKIPGLNDELKGFLYLKR